MYFKDLNDKLNRPFSNNENVVTLKSLSPLKASGDDELGVVFYQRFLHILGRDVASFLY